jgi:hypothetical protein
VKIQTYADITIALELQRGEWTMRDDSWSVATVSLTVRKRADGEWGTRINHSGFKAYERRRTVRDKIAFGDAKFPGFYPTRFDIPSPVFMAVFEAYDLANTFPDLLPPIDEGRWASA